MMSILKINSIRIDVAKNYMINEMDKKKITYAAMVSYAKLIFHKEVVFPEI